MDVAIQDFLQLFNNTHIVKFAQSEWYIFVLFTEHTFDSFCPSSVAIETQKLDLYNKS